MNSMKKAQRVRTRIPPSPTGEPHIGNLRTALFNYLFAKKHGGDFIFRIEDTDQVRCKTEYIFSLIRAFEWAGIIPDEGPYIDNNGELREKGSYGPYIQSKRLSLYNDYVQKLLSNGTAYYCFCSAERLEVMRKEQSAKKLPPLYDKHCEYLSKKDIEQELSSGKRPCVRLNIPHTGFTSFDDIIKGKIEFENRLIDHQIVMKSDGFPTYHLAHVVDDALMEISHVIRGEEWVSSTPKHVFLYQALGFEIPEFAHLPLVLAEDKSKLSKRHGAVSVLDFKDQGYLPSALVNFLALLGWNPGEGDTQEIFSLHELIKKFDFAHVQKSPAVFRYDKLRWLNNSYIKQLTPENLADKIKPYIQEDSDSAMNAHLQSRETLVKIARLFQDRLETFAQIKELSSFLWKNMLDYETNILIWKKFVLHPHKYEITIQMLEKSLSLVTHTQKHNPKLSASLLRETFQNRCKKDTISIGELLWPLRVAVSGAERSPDVFEIIEILGYDNTQSRIELAIKKLKMNEK